MDTYSDARFIVVGTPAGITLAPEGGAHQSTMTASVGLELPGVDFCEPAFATALDWLLCDALRRLGDPSGSSTYLRLSTRPLDQEPFATLEQEKTTVELRRRRARRWIPALGNVISRLPSGHPRRKRGRNA